MLRVEKCAFFGGVARISIWAVGIFCRRLSGGCISVVLQTWYFSSLGIRRLWIPSIFPSRFWVLQWVFLRGAEVVERVQRKADEVRHFRGGCAELLWGEGVPPSPIGSRDSCGLFWLVFGSSLIVDDSCIADL